MRYFVGFLLFLLGVGVVRLVGCGEAAECQTAADCDDQSVCTDDSCRQGSCAYIPVTEPLTLQCDRDGSSGFCVDGVCEENPCDDGSNCTDEAPRISDGACLNTGVYSDGTPCDSAGVPGVCIAAICRRNNPCEGVVCDDKDLCTDDSCDYVNVGVCRFVPRRCPDGNECTNDACDPETGECIHEPVPDGEGCCVRGGTCPGICIPGGCGWCCFERGECRDGECVRG